MYYICDIIIKIDEFETVTFFTRAWICSLGFKCMKHGQIYLLDVYCDILFLVDHRFSLLYNKSCFFLVKKHCRGKIRIKNPLKSFRKELCVSPSLLDFNVFQCTEPFLTFPVEKILFKINNKDI